MKSYFLLVGTSPHDAVRMHALKSLALALVASRRPTLYLRLRLIVVELLRAHLYFAARLGTCVVLVAVILAVNR